MLNITIPKVERPTQREKATNFINHIFGGIWRAEVDKDHPGVPQSRDIPWDSNSCYRIPKKYADRDPLVWEDEDGHTLM